MNHPIAALPSKVETPFISVGEAAGGYSWVEEGFRDGVKFGEAVELGFQDEVQFGEAVELGFEDEVQFGEAVELGFRDGVKFGKKLMRVGDLIRGELSINSTCTLHPCSTLLLSVGGVKPSAAGDY